LDGDGDGYGDGDGTNAEYRLIDTFSLNSIKSEIEN